MENDGFKFDCMFFDIQVGWKSLIGLAALGLAIAAIIFVTHR